MRIDRNTISEIIRAFKLSLCYFAKFIWAKSTYYYLNFAAFHYYLSEKIINCKKQILIICVPRGFGKSKIVSVLFAIWGVFVDNRNYVMLISYAQSKSKENLEDIINLMEHSFFKKIFPWARGASWRPRSDGKIDIDILNRKTGGVERSVIIRAEGVYGSILGASRGEARPDMAIWDDLEDPEKATVKEQVDKLGRWILKTALPGLAAKTRDGRQGRVVWIGTPHSPGCMIERGMTRQWYSNVAVVKLPALAEYPYMGDKALDRINRIADDYDLPKVEKNGSIWEELISTDSLREKRDSYTKKGELADFMLEYMMDSSMNKKFKFDSKKHKLISKAEAVEKLHKVKKIVCVFDMAYTEESYSDYIGINICAHFDNARMVVLRGDKVKINQNEFYDCCKQIYFDYEPYMDKFEMFAESRQFEVIRAFFYERNIREGLNIEICPIKERSNWKKENRIGTLIPYHELGLIEIVEDESMPLLADMAVWDGTVKKRAGAEDALDAFGYQTLFTVESERRVDKEEIEDDRIVGTRVKRYFKEQERKKRSKKYSFYNGY